MERDNTRFFPEENASLVKLTDERVTSGRSLDNNRITLDLDEDRNIVGITFMDVSNGIDLGSLPKELLEVDVDPDTTPQHG